MTVENVSAAFDLLQKKRQALQQALRVALVVERLNRCLEAVLISKNPGGYLPQEALRFYEELGERSRAISTPMLKEYIGKLEGLVEVNFKHILEITRLAARPSSPEAAAEAVGDIDGFVQEFSGHARTLVGMRVLLHKRGEPSNGLRLEIPKHSIQQRLKQLRDREGCFRERIRQDVKRMQDDTLTLLSHPRLHEGMHALLQQTYDDLQLTLEHIDAGGDLAEIPVKVESIQLDSSPLSKETFCRQVVELGAPPAGPAHHDTASVAPAKQAAPARRPFWTALKRWLNTPFRVSWRDVREGRK